MNGPHTPNPDYVIPYSDPFPEFCKGNRLDAHAWFSIVWFSIAVALGACLMLLTESYTAKNSLGHLIILPIFFFVLFFWLFGHVVDCTLGCSSWATAATSISYICANIWVEGFAYLMTMLTMMALIFNRRIDKVSDSRKFRMKKRDEDEEDEEVMQSSTWEALVDWSFCAAWRRVHRLFPGRCRVQRKQQESEEPQPFASDEWGETLMRLGFTLATVTGFLPAKADNCAISRVFKATAATHAYCWEELAATLHGYAIVFGVFLSVVGVQLRLIKPLNRTLAPPIYPDDVRLTIAVALCELCFLFTLGFTTGWFARYSFEKGAAAVDICVNHNDIMACTGADLPIMQLQWAENRTFGWQCRWGEDTPFHESPCQRHDCNAEGRLSTNIEGIMMEYFVFLFWILGTSFALQAILSLEQRDRHKRARQKKDDLRHGKELRTFMKEQELKDEEGGAEGASEAQEASISSIERFRSGGNKLLDVLRMHGKVVDTHAKHMLITDIEDIRKGKVKLNRWWPTTLDLMQPTLCNAGDKPVEGESGREYVVAVVVSTEHLRAWAYLSFIVMVLVGVTLTKLYDDNLPHAMHNRTSLLSRMYGYDNICINFDFPPSS